MRELTPTHHRQAACWASLIALFFAMFSVTALAQSSRLSDLYRQSWTTRDGLPHNSVNGIAQTPDGYLWLATWEGVARFNGRSFENFDRARVPEMADSALRALLVDEQGNLLAGGGRGGVLRHTADHWSALPSAPGLVTDLAMDRGKSLWVGTENSGLWRIDPDQRTQFYGAAEGFASLSVQGVSEDGDGQLWAATLAGLHRREGNRWVLPNAWRGLPAGAINAVSVDSQGRLLVASTMGSFRNEGGAQPQFVAIHPDLTGVSTTRIMEHPDGSLWVGTLNRGLFRVGAFGLESLGTGDGVPSSRVLALKRDREGNVWVGTLAGLFRFSDAPFISVTRAQGLSNDYARTVLALADGALLVGTSQGLNLIKDERVVHLGQGTLLEGASVLSLTAAKRGGFWIGTQGKGVLRWMDGRIVEQFSTLQNLPSDDVRALVETADGTLWVGTSSGVVRRTKTALERYGKSNGLGDDFVISMELDQRGRVWVGTGFGAAVWEGGRFETLSLAPLDGAHSVFDFHEEPGGGAMWVATDRGLLRVPAEGNVGAIGLAQGVPFEKVFGVAIDSFGNLWISGNRGVSRLALSDAQAVARGERATLPSERFTEADGMASSQSNGGSNPSIALRADGSLWVPTSVGVASVNPGQLERFEQMAPPVVIESLLADGKSMPLGGPVRLKPGTNRIEIRFCGLSYVMPERIRYRQRLQGFDSTWIERRGDSQSEFTNLPPGDYVFQVEAAHPRGQWGQSKAELHFSVLPSFWQQRITWAIAALMLAALVFAAVSWRVRRLSINEHRLRRVVEERTAQLQIQKEQLREQAERFAQQASEDPLTGLTNRRGFDAALAREFSRWQRTGTPLCVAMLDIDHFKRVNDRWSHDVGDIVLKRMATILRHSMRVADVPARWGGEEFVILMPDTPLEEAMQMCERLRERLAKLDFSDVDPELHITASFGVSAAEEGTDQSRFLSRADAALYRAKDKGRNRVEL